MQAPGFWDDQESAARTSAAHTRARRKLELWEGIAADVEDLDELAELAAEDAEMAAELDSQLSSIERRLAELEEERLFSGSHDSGDAVVTVRAGAGGTDSQDWAEMLLRMYLRWAENHDFRAEVTDFQAGDEAGVKSVTFLVEGDFAYGYLSAEIGVHRLVRISPFDAGARRHTSFASVFVTPEIEDDVEVEIDEKDLRIDTYRSSGAGGQHVNVTDSAVRITHLPTGIVVQCQNERSQHRNRDVAMKILRSKLYELELKKRREELQEVENQKADIAWGSQIRSYVLQPYRMVKDHRTKEERGDVDRVLDGDLDSFITAFLKEKSRLRQKSQQNV
jgi:peptide chain release factor 2